MPRPIVFTSKVILKKKLTWKIMYLKLKLIDPLSIDFKPGQFVSVLVGEDTYRAYSIASDSKDINNIELIVEYAHDGIGANFFKNLKVGDKVEFIGPSGKFFLNELNVDRIVFFATGSGITPFLPMLNKLIDKDFKGEVVLLWGFRYKKDIFYTKTLNKIKKRLKDFKYYTYLSQENDQVDNDVKLGRVSDDIFEFVFKNTHYYLCGNPSMVREVEDRLLSKGTKEELIFKEEFTYSK